MATTSRIRANQCVNRLQTLTPPYSMKSNVYAQSAQSECGKSAAQSATRSTAPDLLRATPSDTDRATTGSGSDQRAREVFDQRLRRFQFRPRDDQPRTAARLPHARGKIRMQPDRCRTVRIVGAVPHVQEVLRGQALRQHHFVL